MTELKVGDIAPDFELPTGEGTTASLKEFRGRKVVLYFYPKDDTPGCTKEACSFRDSLAAVKRKGAVILGVSPDSPESHQKFAAKYRLPFTLLSDGEKTMVKDYGVWKEKNMYGRKYMGTERTTFVINHKGIITHIFPKVKVEGHVQEILKAL